jgi:hypothetical protein
VHAPWQVKKLPKFSSGKSLGVLVFEGFDLPLHSGTWPKVLQALKLEKPLFAEMEFWARFVFGTKIAYS